MTKLASYEEAMARLMAPPTPATEHHKGQIIIISVGTGKSQDYFFLHKDLLCEWSAPFRNFFSTNPTVTEIDRPDENPYIFSLCVQWLQNHTHANSLPTGLPSASSARSDTITPEQKTQLLKLLARVSKTLYARPFSKPVAEMWPKFAERYAEQIVDPIDLRTIYNTLQADGYSNLNTLKADFDLFHAANLRTKVFERIDAIELTSAGACEIQEDTTARELCHTLQKLICVSERYGLDSLSASCMDTITSLYKTHQLRPSADNILEIYSQTDPGSKLRLYVAQTLAYELVSKASEEGGNGNDEMSLIWGVMKENDELGVDVLVELAKMD